MNEGLVQAVLEAHGGLDRWNQLSKVNVTIVSGGKLFEMMNQPQNSAPRYMEIDLHREHLKMTPYGGPDKTTNFSPDRIAIESLDGKVLSERKGKVEELHNHMKTAGWDALDRAYFNGYANWTYLVTPFFLALPDVDIKEIAPWRYNDETWKGLRVTFPDRISTHNKTQDFYFGSDGLLRRHDYYIDVAGNFEATQYVSRYTEADGIKLPTKRMAYKKKPDGLPATEELMVYIDYSDIHFS